MQPTGGTFVNPPLTRTLLKLSDDVVCKFIMKPK